MTVGPAVGDPISGQPTSQQASTPVAPQGYDPNPPTHIDIDGEQISIDELRNGYMRQRDYTQKTQVLAADRARYEAANQIVQALQNDPEGTLREMAQAMGLDLGRLAGTPALPEGEFGEPEGLDPTDPVAQELMELRAMTQDLHGGLEAQQSAQLEAWLDSQMAEVEQLAAQLGIEYDEYAVYEFALENNIDDPLQAFRAMAFDAVAQGNPRPLPDVRGLKQQVAMQQPRSGMLQPAYDPADQPPPATPGDALRAVMAELGIRDFDQVSFDDSNMAYGG